jgi:hypothetical protein
VASTAIKVRLGMAKLSKVLHGPFLHGPQEEKGCDEIHVHSVAAIPPLDLHSVYQRAGLSAAPFTLRRCGIRSRTISFAFVHPKTIQNPSSRAFQLRAMGPDLLNFRST